MKGATVARFRMAASKRKRRQLHHSAKHAEGGREAKGKSGACQRVRADDSADDSAEECGYGESALAGNAFAECSQLRKNASEDDDGEMGVERERERESPVQSRSHR